MSRLVILESPYAAATPEERERNQVYLVRCVEDSLSKGESPYASHMMLTKALKDAVPSERERGITAGFAWRPKAELTVAYLDYGTTPGMARGIEDAWAQGQNVIYRKIGLNP